MDQKLNDIKFGLLAEHELRWLIERAERETEKRGEKPEEYIEAVHVDDGCEGYYCLKENFHKIPSDQLHSQISQTLAQGSSITFSLEKYEKSEYAQSCARYEWKLDDGSNTEVEEEEDEDENED